MASRSSPRRALVAAFLGDAVEWHSVIRRRLGGKAGGMPDATPATVPDMEALAAEVAGFLESAPVAEALGAKLHRLLHGFLLGDVLPQAERAADLGLDPTPLLAVVSGVLRLYVDALEPGSRSTADRLPGAPLEVSPP